MMLYCRVGGFVCFRGGVVVNVVFIYYYCVEMVVVGLGGVFGDFYFFFVGIFVEGIFIAFVKFFECYKWGA